MIVSRDKDSYCWLTNIDTFRTDLFLGNINDTEVNNSDAGNPNLHIYSKENIYTVTGNDFGE